ncbi:hypothetical protein ACHQM5_014436 [Ranunculus cassubicifolius]
MEDPHSSRKNRATSTRPWADLSEDILVTIYEKLSLPNRLKGPPLCCTSWYKASKNPSLWSKIYIPDFFDQYRGLRTWCPPRQLVEFVVNRSQGLLTSIAFVPKNTVQDLLFVAERCPKLKHLNLKLKEFNRATFTKEVVEGKKTVCTAIGKLKELESLKVDDELFISDETVLQTIAQNCSNFHKLEVIDSTISKNTALLIVKYLPKLKTLHFAWVDIHRKDLLIILNGCLELEDVDISGSGKISGEDEILKIGQERFKKFEWETEVEYSCQRCEQMIDYDFEGYYEWPCQHTNEDGEYREYIDGTKEMIRELHPDDYDEEDNFQYICLLFRVM